MLTTETRRTRRRDSGSLIRDLRVHRASLMDGAGAAWTEREEREPFPRGGTNRASDRLGDRGTSRARPWAARICLRGMSLFRAEAGWNPVWPPSAASRALQESTDRMRVSHGYRRRRTSGRRDQGGGPDHADTRSTNAHLFAAERVQDRSSDEFQRCDAEGGSPSFRAIGGMIDFRPDPPCSPCLRGNSEPLKLPL